MEVPPVFTRACKKEKILMRGTCTSTSAVTQESENKFDVFFNC